MWALKSSSVLEDEIWCGGDDGFGLWGGAEPGARRTENECNTALFATGCSQLDVREGANHGVKMWRACGCWSAY